MNRQYCKECGKELTLKDTQLKVRYYGGQKKTFIRKLYDCTNPDCELYQRFSEPDCEHNWARYDLGKYMFEHCHICTKCGYMVCVDSSG